MNNTKYPATVRELGDMAAQLGMKPTELLEMLGPIPMPPAGYSLAKGSDVRWIGPGRVTRRWIITPAWNATTDARSLEVWMADHKAPNYAELSPTDAIDLAADLIAAARDMQSASTDEGAQG